MLEAILDSYSDDSRHSDPSRKPTWKRLRGGVWLDHAQLLSGMEPKEFADTFIHRNRSASNLVAKWKSGATLPSRSSAERVERHLPGTLEMFDLPVYELLAGNFVPRKLADEFVETHLEKVDLGWRWLFPGEPASHIYYELDYCRYLLSRDDIWGFTAIAALVRQAEANGEASRHLVLCQQLYRALPAVLKIPWFEPAVELLRNCVDDIRSRLLFSKMMFDVDWSIILKLAADPAYKWNDANRPIDSATRRPVEYPDPILEATLISGLQVREQKLARIESRKKSFTNNRK